MTGDRRSLIQWLLGGGFTASILSFLYPAIRFMSPPRIPEAAVNEVSAGRADDVKPNTAKIVRFGSRPVLLVRAGEEEWKAFDGVCTHLNCTVQYRPDGHDIWCACHNGIYDLNGRVIAGPPPRPLEQYAVRIRDGEIVIARRA